MPDRIALVSCVKSKQACPCQARDLYTSALFRKMRAYAERKADAWYILSAKHGLVRPDEVLAPYEQTLNNMGVKARRAWAGQVFEQMQAANLLQPGTVFIWLAGARYKNDLAKLLGDFAQHDPLAGMRMGERLAWLSAPERTADHASLSDGHGADRVE